LTTASQKTSRPPIVLSIAGKTYTTLCVSSITNSFKKEFFWSIILYLLLFIIPPHCAHWATVAVVVPAGVVVIGQFHPVGHVP
jgi:hypothetical protein